MLKSISNKMKMIRGGSCIFTPTATNYFTNELICYVWANSIKLFAEGRRFVTQTFVSDVAVAIALGFFIYSPYNCDK